MLLTILSLAINAKPKANFGTNNTSGCAPVVVQFTDSSTNNPTQWKWDLGNGTVSFLQNPSVTYFNAGEYTIKLIVSNNSGSDTIIKTKYISVFAAPKVAFSSNTTAGCFPLPVQLTNQTNVNNGTADIWQWDFGDGASSNIKEPTHIYATAGFYNVTLRARNNNNCATTLYKTKYIQVYTGVKAAFTNSTPNNCTVPVNIDFKNLSTGSGILSSQWSFGDSTFSSQTSPSHVYTTVGSYTVKLITTNSNGCTDTITKLNAIVAGKVTASFITSDTVCVQQSFLINNNSNPTPLSNSWNFGDGTVASTQNPLKTYTTPGKYTIKLIAGFGACTDSFYKTVMVTPKPTAAFTANTIVACSTPQTVNFTNHSTHETAWFWDFGDGTTSNWQTPSHTYTSTGNFTVKLVVTNANGCSDTIQKTNLIQIQKPVVSLTNLPDSGCVPFTKTFSSTTSSLDAVTGYFWNFGDGNTASTATPTHTYTVAGAFTVSVIITTAGGCKDTAIMQKAITASIQPVVNFSATPTTACAKTTIQFTDLSTGTATSWLWNFGDGSFSNAQNPSHMYSDTGKFSVQLTVTNSGCTGFKFVKDYIHILPPIAAFVFTMDCKKPYERVFLDRSIGADQLTWNFGDGTTSTDRNPIHTYATKGVYVVTQSVVNNETGCDFSIYKTLTIVDVKAAFTMSDSIKCKGGKITFTTNLSTKDITAFTWDFGDGTGATTAANAISHTYTTAGNFSVQLIITNILGCKDTLTKPTGIRVNGPTANFSSSVPGSCLNNAVVFKDLSTSDGLNPIKNYTWNYGDGTIQTSTGAPFSHTYAMQGIYPVSLQVIDSMGCVDSFKLPAPLIISKPVAAFFTNDTLTCPAKTINFTNQSTGPNLSYLWKFGDGITSTLQSPVHSYMADSAYAISLSITDQYGCSDSITRLKYVVIKTPVAIFTVSDSVSICPPLVVQFTNQSVNAVKVNWDFGDTTFTQSDNPSHFYNYPGTYRAQLTITGPGGCVSTQQKQIVIKGPSGSFSYNPLIGCIPMNEKFTATTSEIASIVWDFNDGVTNNTTDSITSHTYTYAGSYLPRIILTDKEGCRVAIKGLDTILVNGVTANFIFSNKTLCDSGTVSFTDSSISNDVIANYNWSMNGSTFSTDQNPVYSYTKNGLYYPVLKVTTQFGCVDSITSSIPIKVVASPHIDIHTTANGCTPLSMELKGVVTVADTSALSWKWDLGDGTISSLQNPTVENYTTAGIYNISAIATNNDGCTNAANKNIEAYVIPVVSAGQNTFICQHHGITLQATGAVSYNWSPAKGLNCVTCSTPVATPDSTTNYIVKGTSIHGCTAQDTINVFVQFPFQIKYSGADTLCKGQTSKLAVTGASSYVWSPAAGLDNNTIATPIAQPDTTTNFMVIAKDGKGCFSDTGYVFVKVYPIPVVNAGTDKTINIGQSYNLIPTISKDVTDIRWFPSTGIVGSVNEAPAPAPIKDEFIGNASGIKIKPSTNIDYVVTVKNAGGCIAKDKVSIFVICNGSNVFIPNTFSPNGDGNNDVFYPRGSGLFKIKNLKIYNRWGQAVFERESFNANDANAGWNGTFNGAKLNPDVFVYVIEIICDNNSILTYKGNITLLQ